MTSKDKDRITEYTIVEKPALATFDKLGYKVINQEEGQKLDKQKQDYILFDVLEKQIKEINPWINENNIKKVVRTITKDLILQDWKKANEDFYHKLINFMTVKQDIGKGLKNHTVKLIDFENAKNNDFRVVNQFRIDNNLFEIIPDIMVFVNGLPLAIIEAKQPSNDWKDEALRQLFGYKEKNQELFIYNQLMIGIAKSNAIYGSTFSTDKYFLPWKKTYPFNEEEIKKLLEKDYLSIQDHLLYSVFEKNNFLDIIQNHIVFEKENNKVLKKVCRYNQYIASRKIFEHLKENKGGLVYHTQGSGKSLTMVFVAQKMRRIEKIEKSNFENPLILIITDRNDLDDQIVSNFQRCGFPNVFSIDFEIKNSNKNSKFLQKCINDSEDNEEDDIDTKSKVELLKKELENGTGKTIFTTIQSFNGDEFPVINKSSNIIVCVDEAHRSNNPTINKNNPSLGWAKNMRKALPNATFIGFTGTPIMKGDKTTTNIFGDYIDKYLPKEAIADGATIPIKYQSRLPQLKVKDSNIDEAFDKLFAEYSLKEKEMIKQKGIKKAIYESDLRIKQIAYDIVEHYINNSYIEGLKAQVVSFSRISATKYKKYIDEAIAVKGLDIKSEVLISKVSDKTPEEKEFNETYVKTKEQEKEVIKHFKKPIDENNLCILIVCTKLITGFDAPIEQVMYLDKELKEHNLMQAIARVNRVYTQNKTYGLIVSYSNFADDLRDALSLYNNSDISSYVSKLEDDIPKLEMARNKAMRFFSKIPKKYDTSQYIDACLEVLKPEDTRIRFEESYKKFIIIMNSLTDFKKDISKYEKDLKFLGKLYANLRQIYNEGNKPSVVGAYKKIKKLVEENLTAKEIEVLNETPIDIYKINFDDIINANRSNNAKASEIETRIRTVLRAKMNENPVHYTSIKDRLEEIILEIRNKVEISLQDILKLNTLSSQLDEEAVSKNIGFNNPIEYAFYLELKKIYVDIHLGKSKHIQLDYNIREKFTKISKELYGEIDDMIVMDDWKNKLEFQKELKKTIKHKIYSLKTYFSLAEINDLTSRIFNIILNRF